MKNTQGSSVRHKEGKAQNFQVTSRLFLPKAHLKDWSGTKITPAPTRLPREAGAAKADAKLGSSTKDRFWGLAEGLENSNLRGNFTELRQIFVFRLLGGERILLGPGGARAGAATGTY